MYSVINQIKKDWTLKAETADEKAMIADVTQKAIENGFFVTHQFLFFQSGRQAVKIEVKKDEVEERHMRDDMLTL
jgi:predicted ABC-type ATPase